jgi:sigma-B regulation protein RsbU (phosphoserine phosphatase)
MIELRTFYKKLDAILNIIFQEISGADFLHSVLVELEKVFGEAIKIKNGRIYEQQDREYLLIYTCEDGSGKIIVPETLPADTRAIRKVLRYGTYIFDDPEISLDPGANKKDQYSIPAAFTINRRDAKYIFVYDLQAGWNREEIEFCFNTVREALNNRLFADGYEYDLKQAANIQKSLLIDHLPEVAGFDLALKSEAAELVIGDLYDFYKHDNAFFGVCIGDACGHGLPAALLVRDVVTGLRMGLEKEMKLAHTVKKLNRVIHRSNYSTRYVSLFCCEIENDGNVLYINAGHPPALIIDNDRAHQLPATGITLGYLPEIDLHRGYARLNPGNLLVMYSDGITERMNQNGTEFGLEGLQGLIIKEQKRKSQELVDMVFDVLYTYGDHQPWQDDTTLIIIKRD